MVTTLLGIFMLVRDSHQLKALFPIVVTLFGIFMLMRDLQPSKASSPIVVTLSGMYMLVSDPQQKYLLLADYQYYTL